MMRFDRAACLAIGAALLGAALQARDGLYSPLAIALLGISMATIAGAVFLFPARNALSDLVLAGCIAVECGLMIGSYPSLRLPMALAVLAVIVAAIVGDRRFDALAFVLLVGVYLFAAGWILHRTPEPFMDVFVFQRDSCAGILHGKNPYAITFPNIYGPGGAWVYAPGVAREGRLLFGFPYMPLTLWWDVIGHLAARDYRYANLVAIAAAAILIALSARSRTGLLAAALLLFTPRGLYVIEQGWSEPMLVLFFVLTIFCASHRQRLLPYAFGLLIASKQYAVFLLLLTPLLTPFVDWRFIFKTLMTAAVVTLPLVLWNPSAFWSSAVMLQFQQPFRADSLSLSALLVAWGGPRLGTLPAILAASVVAAVCVWRMRPSPHHFSLAATVTYLAFVALNKQAFVNYYFFIIAVCSCALANADDGRFTSERAMVR